MTWISNAELIAKGSFGRVFKIFDPRSGEARALKVAVATNGGDPADKSGETIIAEAMLLAEFEQLGKLEHPSLPRVFEVGRTPERVADVPAGAPYFVTEWIAGGQVGGPSDAARWTDAAAIWSLLADLAGALAAIHAGGLVHGDVAPQNILLAPDRAVLVDLGLASGAGARGTPAFMAPEALAGHVDARGDLYGLGASVARLVLGRPPFAGATVGELAYAVLTQPHPALPGVPAALADLIDRLYARDADRRPASALAVLDELDQLAPAIAPDLARRARPAIAPPPAAASWPGADAWIAKLAQSLASPRVHAVVGGQGSGARILVDGAVRRWQLERAAQHKLTTPLVAGTLDEVAGQLGCAPLSAGAALAGWIDRVARTAREHAGMIVLELAEDPRAAGVVAALARAQGAFGTIAIVDPEVRTGEGVARHEVAILDVAGVTTLAATMLGRTPPAAWAEALHAVSGGAAQTTIELVRSLVHEADPFAIVWSARSTAGLAEVRARQLAAIGPRARRLAFAIAAFGGRVALAQVLGALEGEARLADASELELAGLARRHAGEIAIDRAAVEAVEDVAGDELRELANRALGGGGMALALDARAALLGHAELDDELARTACDVADDLLAHGRADRARALALRVIAAAPTGAIAVPRTRTAPVDPAHALATVPPRGTPTAVTARAGMIASRAATSLGAYPEAIELARGAERDGADPIEAQLAIARTSQRAGDLDAAEQTLAELARRHPEHADIAGAYARLLVTRSRYDEARRVARAGGALAGLRAEAAGLAAFYLGELDEADQAFAALEVGATAAGETAAIGRALSLRGMVAQQRGHLGLASDRYRDAVRRLGEVGEIHAAATAELNLGTVLAERGRASEALPRLAAASRVFADLDATTEQIAADLNRGNALVAVGQATEARTAAEHALARAAGSPHLRAFALLVLGDARRRLGDDAGAATAYGEALAIGNERDDAHVQASAYIALAEAGYAPDAGHYPRSLAEVEMLCASDDDRDRWTIARGRLALAHAPRDVRTLELARTAPAISTSAPTIPEPPAYSPFVLAELARACAEVAKRASDADRLERAFRAHAVAAQLAQRGGDRALAAHETERARAAHATIVAAAAPAFRTALDRDPDLVRLAPEAEPAASTSTPARDDAGTALLRRLLTLSRRLNSEAEVARILDEVIDTAIELTAAERGFLLLRQDDGELSPVVSRNFASADLEASDRSVSRSIAERAAQSGEPVITVDAGVDERFAVAASVAALRLRSVLAVPLRQHGTVTGCIYVDHRLRGGAFDDRAASVLGELADIAAIAIENARLTERLRRTTVEVDELNRRLAADLEERDAELVRVKAELPDRDRLRHRYERIVGRSPAMVKMLDLVDRAAVAALPVVIVGESGTGKELVARALHDHGPRKDGAFVAINCSAVPEPLLESELFGHVRGAFTGADRDRRGMFEVADGGTLFLDEIADTSAGMQAKLLRVLQDGAIRRVGETKTRQVNVRVIAAAQRPLAELSAAGAFREDLRFRLEVIAIAVPPLRERDGDIPLLVESLLQRLAPGRPPPRLTRAALRALAQHRWPGNVRELENALARGVAMGGDVLDLEDLPESIAAAAARPEPAKPALGEDLRLKPALVATEQAYITAAMTRAKQNQTVAARLLGLSRFGLQKKLRRLAGEDADDEE